MGWASGLQAGMQLGSTIRQGMLQNELADEAKKYRVTEGAYGPELQQNIDQVRALQAQNPEQAAQYEPAIQELTRRQGLTAPDYSVSSGGYDGGKNYASAQEAQTAMGAQRTQGLASVYRQQGEIEKASELEARALQQKAAGLQVGKLEREEKTAIGTQSASEELASLKAEGTPITSQVLADLAKKHKGDYNTLLAGETAQLGYDEKSSALELKNLKRDLSKAAVGGIPSLNKFLGDKFDPDKTDNITPEIVQTKSGFTVMYGGKVLPEYGTHKSLNELIGTVHGHIDGDPLGTLKTLASIRASDASVTASNAAAGLSGLRAKALSSELEGRSKAGDIAAEYEGLTDAEKAGAKGQGLIRQYNMANAKAGGQISLGAQQRPGQTMTDVEKENLRAFRKWEEDDRNQRLPQAEKDKKATQMGVYNFVNPTANTVQSGLGSNPYANTNVTDKQSTTKQQSVQAAAPKLTSMNTRLLGRAGSMGYNVELPDGTTRVMEKDELEDLGYRLPRVR